MLLEPLGIGIAALEADLALVTALTLPNPGAEVADGSRKALPRLPLPPPLRLREESRPKRTPRSRKRSPPRSRSPFFLIPRPT